MTSSSPIETPPTSEAEVKPAEASPPSPKRDYAHDRPQVPRGFRAFDDPWGITWRVINLFRRISPRRALRFQFARFRRIEYDRPIFILGPPRSGTTTLFHLLGLHPELGSLGREGHDLWRKYHHPRKSGWTSDAVGAGQVRGGEPKYVRRYFYSHFSKRRFVEKTPENCLRIPYLLELFPDAHFVFVKRDPRATISSMINCWRHPEGKFRSYFVPETLSIPGHARPRQWSFALIDGWRLFKSKPIPQIAAEQWRQSTLGALAGRKLAPEGHWHELFLEDLVREPIETLAPLLDALDLPRAPQVMEAAEELRPLNSAKDSGPGDWRENEDEVMAVLPYLAEEIAACGHDFDRLMHVMD